MARREATKARTTGPVLKVFTITGNWFHVQNFVNKHGVARHVVSISEMSGNYTLVALRLTAAQLAYFEEKGWR